MDLLASRARTAEFLGLVGFDKLVRRLRVQVELVDQVLPLRAPPHTCAPHIKARPGAQQMDLLARGAHTKVRAKSVRQAPQGYPRTKPPTRGANLPGKHQRGKVRGEQMPSPSPRNMVRYVSSRGWVMCAGWVG